MSTKSLRNAARSIPKTLWASLRTATLLAVDSLSLFTTAQAPSGAPDAPRALLIRLDYIGDFLLWLPSARSLSQELRRSGMKVVLVCNPIVKELASRENIFDEVIPLDRAKFSGSLSFRKNFLREISSKPWALAVNPTFSREPLFADSVIRFARSKRSVGFQGDSANTQTWALGIASSWYTELLDSAPLHDIDKNEAILRRIAGENALADYSVPRRSENTTKRFNLPTSFAVLFPGVSWEGKKWPLERFVAVGAHLQKSRGLQIVLLGSQSERSDAASIAEKLNSSLTFNLAGETSVPEMMDILAKAQLLVSNDTSAVHAAALAQVPCVTIVGGGHFGRFLPYPAKDARPFSHPSVAHSAMKCYGCAWNCIYPREAGAAVACVSGVPVATVISLVDAALSGKLGEILNA